MSANAQQQAQPSDGTGGASGNLADYPMGSNSYPTYEQVLLGSALYHFRDMILCMTLGTIYTPFDRVATMLTVEGELKRQGILPSPAGFGGIRRCWLRLWEREGVRGCMRSALVTPLLRFPTRLFGDVFSTVLCYHCHSRYHIEPLVVMLGAMIASVVATSPYNILQRFFRTMYRADLKTVAVPAASGDKAVSARAAGWWRRVWRGRGEVHYHFSHIGQVAAHICRRLHWRAVATNILLEIVYKNVFMWLYPVLLNAIPVVKVSFWGRGVTLFLRDVLMQPFRVVTGRMAVSAGFPHTAAHPEQELEVASLPTEDRAAPHRQVPPPHMYTSVWDCVKTIYTEEGVTGMWAGLRYRLLLSCLALGSTLIAPPADDPSAGY
eukprot:gene8981-6303_t